MATKKNTQIGDYEYYRITKTVGHKDGKPIRKQFLGTSKRNAELKYEQWKEEQKERHGFVDANKTFGELCMFYKDNVFAVNSKYTDNTKVRYSGAFERFAKNGKTNILSMPMQDVTPADIQLAYNEFDAHLSTLQALNKFFRGFFGWSVLSGYSSDLLSAVVLPKKPYDKYKDNIVIWTDGELSQIINNADRPKLKMMSVIGAYSGLRIGEVLALQKGDIDQTAIHVTKQLQNGDLVPCKYGSERDIPLHPFLKAEYELYMQGLDSDFLFTTSTGRLIDYSSIKHQFRNMYKRIGVPHKSFHTYRATFCTNLCRSGVPIQIAADLMGHKSVDVTARFYTFIDAQSKIDAIKSLT